MDAFHSMTGFLQMECRPFNIKVMLVSPGAVKSNISDNQAATFKLPPGSLYTGFIHNILERLYTSQSLRTMPTDVFAQTVVSSALHQNPPFYLTAGGNSTIFAILRWLPRIWEMNILWWLFSRPKLA